MFTLAVQEADAWVTVLSLCVNCSILRDQVGSCVISHLHMDPFDHFCAWLRDRCMACLLNGVNVDIRGHKWGFYTLINPFFGSINVSGLSTCER